MATWVLIPCLVKLFSEFDIIAPYRDTASDGRVGDTAHQGSVSDHNPDETGNVPSHDADSINEVHAIDVDNNLNSYITMEDVIQFLLSECRKENGTDRGRLKYIIYNKRIWEAKNNWEQRAYTGSSPHTEHAHFSAEYDSNLESDISTWGLIERFIGTMGDLIKKGDRGEDVRYWQLIHNAVRTSFDPDLSAITADGDYGDATQKAIVSFWKAVGGTGTYDGSYLHAWTALKYLTRYIQYATAPDVVINPEQLSTLVNEWLSTHVPNKLNLAGEVKGKVSFE